jgi:uncharacterized protein
MKTIILLIIFVITLTNCSGMLYHPTKFNYADIKSLSHKPEELIIYQNLEENKRLTAWYFRASTDPKAIIILFHGNAQNLSSHFYSMYWAVDEGYDLFVFDYPGYGASLGKPSPQNTVESGTIAIEYVRKKWPNKPYIIVGQSLGGAIATRTVADLSDRHGLCAMVIDSSFLSYKEIGRDVLSRNKITWPFQWLSYLLLSDKYAPKDDIKKISPIPLMVIHRSDDPVIPIKFGEEIYQAANEPKEFLALKGEGHVNAFTSNDKSANQQKLINFLQKCH